LVEQKSEQSLQAFHLPKTPDELRIDYQPSSRAFLGGGGTTDNTPGDFVMSGSRVLDSIALVMCGLVFSAGTALGAYTSPFVGTWVLNRAKSNFHGDSGYRSQTMTVTDAGTLTADRKLAHNLQDGALFVAVGVDNSIFLKAATELAGEFSGTARAIVSDGAY
jgi:hypothetical protein